MAYFELIKESISLAPFMRLVTHAQKLQRKHYGAYSVRPFHFLRQEAWFDREDTKMYTCKWCYLQVVPTLEKKHIECRKKISKQVRIRKANLEGLFSATDTRFLTDTRKRPLKVIGSKWLKG